MWPKIGETDTYSYFYGLSMVVHLGLALWLCRRRAIRLRVGVGLSLCYAWGMSIGAKILYDLLHHRLDWHNYLDGSYYFADGMWGGPLAYLAVAVAAIVIFARDKRGLVDVAVLALPVPMMLAKVACFVNGCCYGAACDWPWALSFAEGADAPAGIPRHATQLYESGVLLVIQLVFVALDRKRWLGTLVLWFVALYGLGRPLSEFFRAPAEREPFIGTLTASQAVCLSASLICLITLLIYSARTSKPSPEPEDSGIAQDTA